MESEVNDGNTVNNNTVWRDDGWNRRRRYPAEGWSISQHNSLVPNLIQANRQWAVFLLGFQSTCRRLVCCLWKHRQTDIHERVWDEILFKGTQNEMGKDATKKNAGNPELTGLFEVLAHRSSNRPSLRIEKVPQHRIIISRRPNCIWLNWNVICLFAFRLWTVQQLTGADELNPRCEIEQHN